ncbi:MAG: branched-chain amino acid ABC transporter substrate-binding protein [Gammaproteobacteria bacterium]|nr:MAG: branched-chain amino acid ABC transporter substrate-binding protein [Gammaproteobacteria bacterium]
MLAKFTKSIIAAAMFTFAFVPSSFSADTIKIAIVGPITGPVAQYGKMQMDGASMAVDQINSKGGVNGKKLEAVLLDDVCQPKQAVAVANKVVSRGISFVVGHLCSGSTQPASDIYDEEGVLMITPASTSPEITKRGFEMLFRTIGLDSQQGDVAAKFIIDEIKPKRVAIIHDKQQYGQGLAEVVKKQLNASNVKVVLFEGVTKGSNDFSALISKIKGLDVDFIYYGGYHPELGLILRQARERGLKSRFMGPEGVGNKDISAIAGEASEGLLVTLPADFTTDPANAGLVKAFDDKKLDSSGPFVMPSYAAVQIIADTIAKSKSEDPYTVAKLMKKSTYQTPIGTVAFQKNGDLKAFKFIVYNWHADGTKTPAK